MNFMEEQPKAMSIFWAGGDIAVNIMVGDVQKT
jgi:hypothetical protein